MRSLDRSRVYLSLCDRQLQLSTGEPANAAEGLYVRNRHQVAEQGDGGVAIRYLEQAIEANPENRSLARIDPDLDTLRRESALGALLGALQGSGKRAARR